MTTLPQDRRLEERLDSLPKAWRARADAFAEHHCDELAAAYRQAADELDQVLSTCEDELLNLKQAESASGYSADHLGRLVREGKIPNAGRTNAPKIRRRDLPGKASRLRAQDSPLILVGATPGQIARAVVDSEGEQR